ncbi:Uncharacterised protein [Lysinibacillus sphaericus]|uniref:Uncharacterized protein n=1 Tax=Lysinibacillus sphaericus TaxID=1421 RepID=A0AAJ4ZUW2_LYSSH|nr:hypothetical protein T479_09910 [Lysinibacillus varians]SUV16985.1 Uncharacterised protein [Lysinibacillus sphaericus]
MNKLEQTTQELLKVGYTLEEIIEQTIMQHGTAN